jgi:hypothetical protein
MTWRVRAHTTRRETLERSTRTVGLPAQTLEDCVSSCDAPADFGAARAVIWFHSNTDGDSVLERLRPVLRFGF